MNPGRHRWGDSRLLFLLHALMLTLLVGCGRSSAPVSPTVAEDPPETVVGSGGVVVGDDVVEAALGMYRWEIDPVGLTVSSSMPERHMQKTDSLYLLGVSQFFGPDDLTIQAVARQGNLLQVTYHVRHPFRAATNRNGPATATNRADLGIAGRLAILAEVPSGIGNMYFGDTQDPVIANTALVANPDAYFRPNGLLRQTTIANTFPYKSLVNETGPTGSRLGISNGGDPRGNYGTDGWTQGELGATNDRWTGYGVLHQGQTSRRMLAFDLSSVGDGTISFDVAILAKYNDPRGGVTIDEKRANRLPPEVPDPLKFAYRMPHGALDVERIRLVGTPTRLFANLEGNLALPIAITDWDARATETTESELANDLTVTNVEVGESGAPELAVCAPGVIGDAAMVTHFPAEDWLVDDDRAIGGDPGVDSGAPGDELYYPLVASKPVTSGQMPGEYTGMVRATDVEADLDTRAWRFHFDEQLHPFTGNLPRPETYQAFIVTLEAPPVRHSGWQYAPNGGGDEVITSIAVDGQNNTIVAGYVDETGEVGVDYGGGTRQDGGDNDMFLVKLDPQGSYQWDRHFAAADLQYARDIAVDHEGNIFLTGSIRGAVDFGGGERTASAGGMFLAKFNKSGSYRWDRVFGGQDEGTAGALALTLDMDGRISVLGVFSSAVNFGGGPRNAQATDTVILLVDGAGQYVRDTLLSGSGYDEFYQMAVDSTNSHYVSGEFYGVADYGTGPIDSVGGQELVLVKINPSGTVIRVQQFGGENYDWVHDVAVEPSSQAVLMTGYSSSPTIDFGGGIRTQVGGAETFIVKFSAEGAYLWDHYYGYHGNQLGSSVVVSENGDIFLGGFLQAWTDFGCGNMESLGRHDAFVVKYDSAGTPQWSRAWGGDLEETIWSIALAPDGTLRTGGYFESVAMDFDPGPGVKLDSAVNRDLFVTSINCSDGLW